MYPYMYRFGFLPNNNAWFTMRYQKRGCLGFDTPSLKGLEAKPLPLWALAPLWIIFKGVKNPQGNRQGRSNHLSVCWSRRQKRKPRMFNYSYSIINTHDVLWKRSNKFLNLLSRCLTFCFTLNLCRMKKFQLLLPLFRKIASRLFRHGISLYLRISVRFKLRV